MGKNSYLSRLWKRRLAAVASFAVILGLAPLGAAPTPAGAVPTERAASATGDRCLVRATHQVFLGREASNSEVSSWTSRFNSGVHRSRLPNELANSNEWLGVEVSKLYRGALDREPDSAGRAYWVDQLRRGAMVNRVGSLVYGSNEFYTKAGGTPTGFVNSIYTRILGRAPDASGRAYWVGQVGSLGRSAVASSFFASLESRTTRVKSLYTQILDRSPAAGDVNYWTGQLNRVNDVRLAVQLASAAEFYDRNARCESPGPIKFGQTVYGAISTAGQQNTYTLAARSGDRLSVDTYTTCCNFRMTLTAPNGATIWNAEGLADRWIALTQNGTYRLTISRSSGTGDYSFHVSNQRNPQTFNIGYGTTISNGSPQAGMGNIERPGSVDVYRFTGATGDRLSFDRDYNFCCAADITLTAPNGAVIWNKLSWEDRWVTLSQNGTYQLRVSQGTSSWVGTYNFYLSNQRNPQTFNIGYGTTISNGSPQAGMGNIERPGSVDVYRFTGATGDRLSFDRDYNFCCAADITLTAPNGAVIWNKLSWEDRSVTLSQNGTYQLRVSQGTSSWVGTYNFRLLKL